MPRAPANPPTIDPQRVQRALVCMHLDPAYAAALRGHGPLPGPTSLTEGERDLLRGVDPRALRTDAMRRARLLQALLEEFPVSASILGIPAIDGFLSTAEFRAAIFGRGRVALALADYLGSRRELAGALAGVLPLEATLARLRRPATDPSMESSSVSAAAAEDRQRLGLRPGIAALIVPRATLQWYREACARLGPDPLATLAEAAARAKRAERAGRANGAPRGSRKRKRTDSTDRASRAGGANRASSPQHPPRPGEGPQYLVIEGRGAGEFAIGEASEPLCRLLLAASPPRPRAALRRVAIDLGAETSEADELLDELCADGLLCALPPR